MKALVIDGVGGADVLDVADPMHDDLAIVEMRAAGICGTDLHIVDGLIPRPPGPMILGHEGAGVIRSLPDRHSDLAVGDRVAIFTLRVCGTCDRCLSGHEEVCANSPGQLGFSVDGTFADLVGVPVENLIRIPDSVSFESAALMGCAGLTAVHAVGVAEIRLGDHVVVTGAGGVSLMCAQAARVAGATVTAVTRDHAKESLLTSAGAHHVIILGPDGYAGLPQRVRESGMPVAHVLDVVGSSETVGAALRVVEPYGTVTLVGAVGDELRISAYNVLLSQARLIGTLAGTRAEMRTALDLAARGALVAQVDSTVGLADVPIALRRQRDGGVHGRIVVTWPN